MVRNRIWKPPLILSKENQKKSYAHRNTQFGGTKKVVKIGMYEATAQSHFLFISVIFLLNCICILKAFSLLGNVSLYRLPGSQGIIHSSAISPKYLHSVHTFLMHQFLLQQVPEVAAFTFPKFIFCLTLILNLILKVNNC